MKNLTLTSICALLILLFLYTGFSKFFDMWTFKYDLSNQPFPVMLQHIFLYAVPITETLISILLFFERTRMTGLVAAMGLMALFTLYTATILLHFFPFMPCGCGGVIRMLTWPQHLIFNLFFLSISIWGITIQRQVNQVKFTPL